MNALLTDNLPLLTDAPNGIKKLRNLILGLAMRGKLVPQDPNDEPASELLKRIADEKVRLAAQGKTKKQKSLADVTGEEKLFDLPKGWERVRFGVLIELISGQHLGPEEYFGDPKDGAIPYLTGPADFGEVFPRPTRHTFERRAVSVEGDILLTVKGSGVGKTNFVDKPMLAISRQLMAIRPVLVNRQFVRNMLFSMADHFQSKSIGIAIPGISREDVLDSVVCIPPLVEQLRIVGKVDELMALCDCLEAQQTHAESAHTRLVQALLDSLTQASDATDFATSWQRLAEHFHTLFTTDPTIDALKQTLLQLAVMGKLVPQNATDESADDLLKRISDHRSSYREKKQKSLADISEVEKPFELPPEWAWATLPAIGELARGKSRHRPRNDPSPYAEGNVPLIQTGDVARANGVVKTYNTMYNAKGVAQSRLWPAGTMCITIAANIADTAILGFDACFPDSVVGFTPELSELDVRYFEFFMRTAKSHLEDFAPSTAQKNINLEILGLLSVPLPPVNEIRRIVAKVDQLIALCDQLKTRLTQARQLNAQLASTLVERSLAGDSQQAPMATDRQVARTLLAAEVTHRLHNQRTFGQRKLQKVIYLAEHVAKLNAIQGNYLRDAAGPHDRQVMSTVEGEMQIHQWYERIERETVGHAYRPLSQAGQHRQAYSSTWSAADRATIEQVIELMRDWDTDRCEMTVTLYAAWNDFILEGRPVSDEAIMEEVMHSWNDTKLRFGKTEWLAVLAEMKKHKILMPNGFGKRTTGGMLSLPGFD